MSRLVEWRTFQRCATLLNVNPFTLLAQASACASFLKRPLQTWKQTLQDEFHKRTFAVATKLNNHKRTLAVATKLITTSKYLSQAY